MDVATASPRLAPALGAVTLLALTGLAAIATIVILLLPNAVEVGPSKAVFFDCGTALSPRTDPAQEPGISACKNATQQMRRTAFATALTSLACATVLAIGYYGRRRDR